MKRFLKAGAVAVAVLTLWAGDAMAQRDAGAKMRGDFGRGSSSRSYSGPSFTYQPAQPNAESYRSFAYEPLGIRAGDTVAVRGEGIKMMKGSEVIATLPQGVEFKVTRVINGWLGAVVEIDGEPFNGWIWHGNVTAEDEPVLVPQADRKDATARSDRSFSYEPSQPNRSYRSYQRNDEPWRYLKTDPRRNR